MKRLPGIKLPLRKQAAQRQIRNIPVPELVRIPMLMHRGAPCVPLVKPGEQVTVGQMIGAADDPSAVPVHASVSGTVTAVSQYQTASGEEVPCIEIESDGRQTLFEGCRPPKLENRADLIAAARESG